MPDDPDDPHFFDFDLDRGIREQVVEKLESSPILPLARGGSSTMVPNMLEGARYSVFPVLRLALTGNGERFELCVESAIGNDCEARQDVFQ